MILQEMVDDIQMVFPKVNKTRIIFDINNAIMTFCHITRVLYAKLTLTSGTETDSDTTKPYWTFDLPTYVYEVRSATCCVQEEFEVGDDEITFYFRKDPDEDIELVYSRRPGLLMDNEDEPSIPEIFLPGIIAKVKSKYYSEAGVLQNAGWEKTAWKEAVAEGIRYANTRPLRNIGNGLLGTDGEAGEGEGVTREFAERQTLVQGQNTVTIPGTMPSLNYRILLNGNGVHVVEYNPNETNPPDTRTLQTFEVLSSEDNANFEFYVRGS